MVDRGRGLVGCVFFLECRGGGGENLYDRFKEETPLIGDCQTREGQRRLELKEAFLSLAFQNRKHINATGQNAEKHFVSFALWQATRGGSNYVDSRNQPLADLATNRISAS